MGRRYEWKMGCTKVNIVEWGRCEVKGKDCVAMGQVVVRTGDKKVAVRTAGEDTIQSEVGKLLHPKLLI